MLKLWQAFAYEDNEYFNKKQPIAVFEVEGEAQKAVIGKGAWGQGDGVVEPFIVFSSFDEYTKELERRERAKDPAYQASLVESAKALLTDEQIEAIRNAPNL